MNNNKKKCLCIFLILYFVMVVYSTQLFPFSPYQRPLPPLPKTSALAPPLAQKLRILPTPFSGESQLFISQLYSSCVLNFDFFFQCSTSKKGNKNQNHMGASQITIKLNFLQ